MTIPRMILNWSSEIILIIFDEIHSLLLNLNADKNHTIQRNYTFLYNIYFPQIWTESPGSKPSPVLPLRQNNQSLYFPLQKYIAQILSPVSSILLLLSDRSGHFILSMSTPQGERTQARKCWLPSMVYFVRISIKGNLKDFRKWKNNFWISDRKSWTKPRKLSRVWKILRKNYLPW